MSNIYEDLTSRIETIESESGINPGIMAAGAIDNAEQNHYNAFKHLYGDVKEKLISEHKREELIQRLSTKFVDNYFSIEDERKKYMDVTGRDEAIRYFDYHSKHLIDIAMGEGKGNAYKYYPLHYNTTLSLF